MGACRMIYVYTRLPSACSRARLITCCLEPALRMASSILAKNSWPGHIFDRWGSRHRATCHVLPPLQTIIRLTFFLPQSCSLVLFKILHLLLWLALLLINILEKCLTFDYTCTNFWISALSGQTWGRIIIKNRVSTQLWWSFGSKNRCSVPQKGIMPICLHVVRIL
jgi:hypothetical protein